MLHDGGREIGRVYAKKLQTFVSLRWLASTCCNVGIVLRCLGHVVFRHELVAVAALAKLRLISIGLLRWVVDRNALFFRKEQESMAYVIITVKL